MTPTPGAEGPGGTSGADSMLKLRHDLANPLAALLAETQLLLLSPEQLNAETLSSLKQIETLARRMRQILHDLDP
jgi:signal transduction histidine kinase